MLKLTGLTPVSYTHLPGFRQGLVQHGGEDVGCVPALAGEAQAGAYGVRSEVGAVSYTHLDVYKRQALGRKE